MFTDYRCNEQIAISPIRLIGADDKYVGLVPTADALRMAREAGLNLVEGAPNAHPPFCRIMDFCRWLDEHRS